MKWFKSLVAAHLIFSAIILGAVWFWPSQHRDLLHSSIFSIFIFFLVQGLIITGVIDWVKTNAADKLSFFLLGSVVFRFLTSLMGCVFVLIVGVQSNQLFIINFFAIYFVNLIFEIVSLLANLRPNSGSS